MKKTPVYPRGPEENNFFADDFGVASATDFTGLIPAALPNDLDDDAYSDIYDNPLSRNPKIDER